MEEIKIKESEANSTSKGIQSQVIMTTDNVVFITESCNRRKQMNVILDLAEKLGENIQKIEILRHSIRNIVDFFMDKVNNYEHRKVIVITDSNKMRYHYNTFRFKTIFEERIKEMVHTIEEEKKIDMEKGYLKSSLYYDFDKEDAILIHHYLPSFSPSQKEIVNTVINAIVYNPNLKEDTHHYAGDKEYVVLYRTEESEGVYDLVKTLKGYYKYAMLRGDIYGELPNAEFKIFKIKNNIIVSELTPYSLLTFIRTI